MNDPDGFGKPVALQGHEMKPRLTFYDLSAKGVPHDRCRQPGHSARPLDALSALRDPACLLMSRTFGAGASSLNAKLERISLMAWC